MLLLRNGKSFLKALTYRQKKCLFRKLFDRESFSSGIKSFIQKNISWGKSDKISKKLKTFSVDVFLDKVISSLSLSLCLSAPLSTAVSTITNQTQVFLSKIKTSSREIVTNWPSLRKIHLGPISKLAKTRNPSSAKKFKT